MRRLGMLLPLTVMAAFIPLAAAGQYTMALRGGLFLPSEDALKTKASQWLALGFDVHLTTTFLEGSDTVVSVDYLSHALGGTRGSAWPIMLNQFFYTPMGFGRMYWGIGAGATVADITTASKTVFGLKGTLGMELNTEWFVEASYFWSDEYDPATDGRVNGVAFYLGYRF